jgi:ABC-type phosphate/phosphonate transport system substrate-binding protein
MEHGVCQISRHANNRRKVRVLRFALRIFTLTLCVFALAVFFSPRPLAEKKPEYTFVFYQPAMSTSDQGQIRSIFAELKKSIFERENFVITPIYITNEKDLYSAAKKGKVDIVFPGDDYVAYRLVKEYKFQPFLNVSFLNKKERKTCIYTKSNKNYQNIKDIKNTRINTIFESTEYIILRHIVGEDPMAFFSVMQKANAAYSVFYALSLDTCDAVFTSDSIYNAMKKTNPGPLKGVKELACAAETFPQQGFFCSKKVPKPVIERISAILKNAPKDDALKKWRPLMKSFGISFTDSSIADYKTLFQLFEKAEKRGWMKDYEQLLRSVQD